jgi:acetyl esterase/lipase
MKSTGILLLALAVLGAASAELHTDIEYGQAGTVRLLLDASVPKGSGPFPVAIIVHGGGWGSGDKQRDVAVLFEPLTQAHFAWFSINYRLAPEHRYPASIEDVDQAIRWVSAHAAQFKGDPRRIAVMGYSAGGHLACLAAMRARRERNVAAVVGLAAPTDLVADAERRNGLSNALKNLLDRQTLDDEVRAILGDISPINHVRSGLPPFLLIHGTADKSVPYSQSQNLQARLRAAGVPCELMAIENAPHNILEWDHFDRSYKQQMTAWLNRTLDRAK